MLIRSTPEGAQAHRAESRKGYHRLKELHPQRALEKMRRASDKRRARKYGAAFVENVSRPVLWDRDGGICGICGKPADPQDWHMDHIVPLGKDGPHSYANVRVTHPECNWARTRKSQILVPLAALVALVGTIATPAVGKSLPIRQVAVSERTAQVEMATLAKKVSLLRAQTWQCQDSLGIPRTRASVSAWALPTSIPYRRWVASHWNAQKASCGRALDRRTMEWNWRAFPQWVISLGVCESGGSGGAPPGVPNWYAEGSSSDGVFYSAFNISRSQYDKDAHHMGVRGWREGPGIPSPYEQAMAVIGHMRLLGDGFTGRCHGIARSSWN
jgi:5-methylcytosine-specific restriction endonuclease McrA